MFIFDILRSCFQHDRQEDRSGGNRASHEQVFIAFNLFLGVCSVPSNVYPHVCGYRSSIGVPAWPFCSSMDTAVFYGVLCAVVRHALNIAPPLEIPRPASCLSRPFRVGAHVCMYACIMTRLKQKTGRQGRKVHFHRSRKLEIPIKNEVGPSKIATLWPHKRLGERESELGRRERSTATAVLRLVSHVNLVQPEQTLRTLDMNGGGNQSHNKVGEIDTKKKC